MPALCKITCVCPGKVNGNTSEWNSCKGNRVKPLAVWEQKGNKEKGKKLLFTACRYIGSIGRKHEQSIFCLYSFSSQPVALYLGCWKGIFLNWWRTSKHVYDKYTSETVGPCCDQLTAVSCAKHCNVQVKHETGSRDSHVPLQLLIVCDHCTLLSIRRFHAQRIFFRAEFLRLKEGANETIWSCFPFFRETNWFQNQGWRSKCCWRTRPSKSRQGMYSPRMSPEQLQWLFPSTTQEPTSNLPYLLTPPHSKHFRGGQTRCVLAWAACFYQPCVVYVPLNLSCLISFTA